MFNGKYLNIMGGTKEYDLVRFMVEHVQITAENNQSIADFFSDAVANGSFKLEMDTLDNNPALERAVEDMKTRLARPLRIRQLVGYYFFVVSICVRLEYRDYIREKYPILYDSLWNGDEFISGFAAPLSRILKGFFFDGLGLENADFVGVTPDSIFSSLTRVVTKYKPGERKGRHHITTVVNSVINSNNDQWEAVMGLPLTNLMMRPLEIGFREAIIDFRRAETNEYFRRDEWVELILNFNSIIDGQHPSIAFDADGKILMEQ
ncbi:hypothetical protein PCE1_004854 [Barthelona sp. PCE]